MAGQQDIVAQIRAAPDLGALEGLRVAALGKSGSVTALLKSLGAMDPAARAAEGPKIHALREAVTGAIAARRAALEAAELDRRPAAGPGGSVAPGAGTRAGGPAGRGGRCPARSGRAERRWKPPSSTGGWRPSGSICRCRPRNGRRE